MIENLRQLLDGAHRDLCGLEIHRQFRGVEGDGRASSLGRLTGGGTTSALGAELHFRPHASLN